MLFALWIIFTKTKEKIGRERKKPAEPTATWREVRACERWHVVKCGASASLQRIMSDCRRWL